MKFTRTVMLGTILRRNVITVPKSLKGFGKVCWAYPEQFQRRTPVSMRGSYQETVCHSGEESFQMEKSKMVLTSLSYPSTPSHSATYGDGSFIQDFSRPIIFCNYLNSRWFVKFITKYNLMLRPCLTNYWFENNGRFLYYQLVGLQIQRVFSCQNLWLIGWWWWFNMRKCTRIK